MNEIDIRDIKKFTRTELHDAIVDMVLLEGTHTPDTLVMTKDQFQILKKNLSLESDVNSIKGRLYFTPTNCMEVTVED